MARKKKHTTQTSVCVCVCSRKLCQEKKVGEKKRADNCKLLGYNCGGCSSLCNSKPLFRVSIFAKVNKERLVYKISLVPEKLPTKILNEVIYSQKKSGYYFFQSPGKKHFFSKSSVCVCVCTYPINFFWEKKQHRLWFTFFFSTLVTAICGNYKIWNFIPSMF